MDKEHWVRLATHEKTYGRPNLEEAWRERDYLAATNGHRIHLAYGYPTIEGIRYVDERQDTPPNVQTLIEVLSKAPLVADVTLDKTTFKTLKSLVGIKEQVRCTIKAAQQTTESKASVTLHGRGVVSRLTFELPLTAERVFRTAEITVNLQYLFDALSWMNPAHNNGTIELSWDSREAGAMLQVHAVTKLYTAIIAPMHKD